MREGLPEKLRPSIGRNPEEAQIYTGLDLSRKRLDWHACRADGTLVGVGAVPDPDGLAQLVHRLGDADVLAVVESMNGARFIHDQLELAGGTCASPMRAGAFRAPRPLLHVGAARRRGRVRPYLNLYAHPGLMFELYAGLTLGRSEA